MDNAIELICDLHKRDGVIPIGKMTDLWHRRVDDQWAIWVNGQMQSVKTKPTPGSPGGHPVDPGDVYVEFNGWPCGIFSMITGEGTLAAGKIANYETFCAALRRAIAPADKDSPAA
jgi:hypothetical protein